MKSRRLATRSAKSSSKILGRRFYSSREKIRWKPWIIEIREQNESVPTNEEELRRALESGRSEDWKNIQIPLCALEEHEKTGATYVADGQSPSGGIICLYSILFRAFSGKRTWLTILLINGDLRNSRIGVGTLMGWKIPRTFILWIKRTAWECGRNGRNSIYKKYDHRGNRFVYLNMRFDISKWSYNMSKTRSKFCEEQK